MISLAVIFDIDGVLVDSYGPHFQSWRQLAGEFGCDFNESQFADSFGQTSREILAGNWPVKLSDEQIVAADLRKEYLYRQIIESHFPAMPGARELVRGLHSAGFALAVGSSGPKANVAVSLAGLGLGELFGAVVTGEDIIHGKPDPAVFLAAADRLGVSPALCAVVEDAPAGIQAAKRAGMTAIALTGTVSRDRLAAADLIVDSLDQLTRDRIAEAIRQRVAGIGK
ncbi:MAG: HAD family phosphatase [Planctomycetes bacterium]|nr:HAD family phosphatase [Planctomycetota bacterium]